MQFTTILSFQHLPNSFCIVDVADYIKNFTWDDNKFHRGRSLVEIAGLISDVSSKSFILIFLFFRK
jgi:hypothetical protein